MDIHSPIGTSSLVAEAFHVDFTGHLLMGVLGNHLLNAAGRHAAERGFGMATINESRYTWVLSRMVIEMDYMPCEYESFEIDTWVESIYKLFTNRNFEIRQGDKAIGYARSIWAMIDMDTRQPVDVLRLHGDGISSYVYDKDCPIEGPSRIRVRSTEPRTSLRMNYSDIDVNCHVNSIRYIEHIMDQFPREYLASKRVKRFDIAYSSECYWGDEVLVFMDEVQEDMFDIELRRKIDETKTETAVKCRLSFVTCE